MRRGIPLLFLVLVILCVGCGEDASSVPSRVPRQPSDPFVPKHPRRQVFVGEWAQDGDTEFIIHRDKEGRVLIDVPKNLVWDSVVNNVRFEGDSLCFDQYMYYTGPANFTSLGNPVGDHPYSGVRNASVLSPNPDDPNVLEYSLKTKDIEAPFEGQLQKVGKEANKPMNTDN